MTSAVPNPDWIGFDLDHTIARYRLDALHQLTLVASVDWLKTFGRYPAEAFAHEPIRSLNVRGATIDRLLGNVIFVNENRVVYRCFHGTTEWSTAQISAAYSDDEALASFEFLTTKRFWPTHSYFETFLPGLFVRLVDWLDAANAQPQRWTQWANCTESRTYEAITDDVHQSLFYIYTDFHRGMFFESFRREPQTYLHKRPFVRKWIERVRATSPNTKVFLATNSMADFTDVLGRFALGDDWKDLFDLVIFKARKPLFFSHGCAKTALDELACFRVRYAGPWTPIIEPTPVNVMQVRTPGQPEAHLFEGGCAAQAEALFRRVSGKAAGDASAAPLVVWYCGDHLIGDCRAAAHCCRAWRACAVVEELAPLERQNAVPIASLCHVDDQQYVSFEVGDPTAQRHHVELYDSKAHAAHPEAQFFFASDGALTFQAKILREDCSLVVSDVHQLCSELNGDPLWMFRHHPRSNVQFVTHKSSHELK